MTDTGHDARTQAVIAHMARMRVERETTRVEGIPDDLQNLILEMAAKINKLEFGQHELEATVEALGRVNLNDLMRKTA